MKKLLIAVLILFLTVPAYGKNDNKQKKQKSLPPGLEKKVERTGQLPPGWQKKLNKGEILDPQIYEIAKTHKVKAEDYFLSPIVGTEVLKIENRIIRIRIDTKEILDVLGI